MKPTLTEESKIITNQQHMFFLLSNQIHQESCSNIINIGNQNL